jgi:hypothetical protein
MKLLQVGDTLIMIDHDGKTENLIEVTELRESPSKGFAWKYKQDKHNTPCPGLNQESFTWANDLNKNTYFHKAMAY